MVAFGGTTTFKYFPPQNKSYIYSQILELFPMQFVWYCCAYGANVFPADGVTPDYDDIIEIVLVTNDTKKFHSSNLEMNRHHYSGLKYLGSSTITKVQENFGGMAYVNTVQIENVKYRYAVIYACDFVWDLQTWSRMYLAGRLLQPIVTLKDSDDERLVDALEDNLVMAVHIALLLLPENFTELQLYERIVKLSYETDFTVSSEEAEKLSKSVVAPRFTYFKRVYESILCSLDKINRLFLRRATTIWVQSIQKEHILFHLTELPTSLVVCLGEGYLQDHPNADYVDAMKNISDYRREHRVELITECMSKLVQRTTISQCVKDLFTNGILDSLRYGSASKLAKLTKSYFFGC